MNNTRPVVDDTPMAARELLSSLADGECPRPDAQRACDGWRGSADARERWHLYHVIGDVLRSDELARGADADAEFLGRLRQRLDHEPVPLAPARPAQPVKSHRWMSSAAAIAGFAVVGAAVFVLRPVGQDASDARLASSASPPPVQSAVAVSTLPAATSPGHLTVDGQVIRDARLDAYFEAHRGAVGPVAPAMPGGALRSVEFLVPQR